MNDEIAKQIELVVKFAKERTATQIRRVLQQTAEMPAGVLADYLEEHYPHLLHDDSVPERFGISSLEVLRSPESSRSNVTVQRHPTSGKIVAYRGPNSKSLLRTLRTRRNWLHGDLVHATNGPGGSYAVFVDPGSWGSSERTSVYPVSAGDLITTGPPISQRTRAHEEAVNEARMRAEAAAFPADRYTQEGYV